MMQSYDLDRLNPKFDLTGPNLRSDQSKHRSRRLYFKLQWQAYHDFVKINAVPPFAAKLSNLDQFPPYILFLIILHGISSHDPDLTQSHRYKILLYRKLLYTGTLSRDVNPRSIQLVCSYCCTSKHVLC